ncbi:MAG: cobalamin biosynthesis protein P47K [Clostridiales bacterium]|nr:cobalamin biosynthesis protein P47K [Clostridiales bacterium]
MKVIIFGGFLGSGKTSLIMSLAHFIVDGRAAGNKTELVIIENEIGKAGIDDKLLKADGLSVRELFAGCICCTLATDITTTLNKLAGEKAPDWVIIECTGLAYIGRLVEILAKYGEGIAGIHTVTVVDADRWKMLLEVTPDLVGGQVTDGDTILINKIDLADESTLKEVIKSVSEIKPGAFLETVTATEAVDEGIWRRVTGIGQ